MIDKEYINVGDPILYSPVGRGVVTAFTDAGYAQVNGIAVGWCERSDGKVFNPTGIGAKAGNLQRGPRPLVPPSPEHVPMQPPSPAHTLGVGQQAPQVPTSTDTPAQASTDTPAQASTDTPAQAEAEESPRRPAMSPAFAAPYGEVKDVNHEPKETAPAPSSAPHQDEYRSSSSSSWSDDSSSSSSSSGDSGGGGEGGSD